MAKKSEQKESIGTIRLHRRTTKQEQLNISDADKLKFLQAAGGDPEKHSVGNPAKSSKSGKEKVTLTYTVSTPQGTVAQLIQADTHGFWAKHQSGEGLELLRKMLDTLTEAGDYTDLEVLSVEMGSGNKGGGRKKEMDF